MTKVLCMSHGPLAKGMVETTKFIIGDNKNLEYLCAYMAGNNDLEELINGYLTINKEESVVVLTDIFGGSINNEWMKCLKMNPNIHLVAGMNLSLVIELLMKLDTSNNISETINESMQTSSQGIVYCNKLNYEVENDEF